MDITGLDIQGDLYEYMLDRLSTAGHNGQFRTPKHIREMMVNLMKPSPNDYICGAVGITNIAVSIYLENADSFSPFKFLINGNTF